MGKKSFFSRNPKTILYLQKLNKTHLAVLLGYETISFDNIKVEIQNFLMPVHCVICWATQNDCRNLIYMKYYYAVCKKGLEIVENWSFIEFTTIFYETDVSNGKDLHNIFIAVSTQKWPNSGPRGWSGGQASPPNLMWLIHYVSKVIIEKSCVGRFLWNRNWAFAWIWKNWQYWEKRVWANYGQLLRVVFSCFQGQKVKKI